MTIIKKLREQIGISQDALARNLGITRQTLIKLEKSLENISAPVLREISKKFNISADDILANKISKEPTYNIIPEKCAPEEKTEERIDIPQENINKFKEVLLYILEKVGAKPNVGQVVIYKLLYFIDFDFYELYEKQLIGAKYMKNTFGPTPVAFKKITEQMQKEGRLEEVKTKFFDHEQTKYLPRCKADISKLSAQEIKHIDAVLEKYSDMTATELSNYSHKDVPWIVTDEKKIIPYESVFYRTPETSVRVY